MQQNSHINKTLINNYVFAWGGGVEQYITVIQNSVIKNIPNVTDFEENVSSNWDLPYVPYIRDSGTV